MLYPDMPPEIKDLLADDKLESIGEGQCNDHGHYTDGGRSHCQPDDKSGKRFTGIEGNFPGNISGKIQAAWF